MNYFTKSGTNTFHGDAYETWNGSPLNAEDYFLHANDTADSVAKKPRSTVNEFGASVGAPIVRDRLFFFAHYEGIRIALPLVSQITLPTPGYQQYVLGQLATGRNGPGDGRGSSGAACRDPLLPKDVLAAARVRRLTGADCRMPAGYKTATALRELKAPGLR